MPTNSATAPESKTVALYLPAVERELQPGIYKELIESARCQGSEYSKMGFCACHLRSVRQ